VVKKLPKADVPATPVTERFESAVTVFDPTAGIDFTYNRAMDIDAAKRADKAQDIAMGTSVLSSVSDVLSSYLSQ